MAGGPIDDASLEARVVALEREVVRLREQLEAARPAAAAPATRGAPPAPSPADPAAVPVHRQADVDRAEHRAKARPRRPVDPGQWLNRVGIALLLFGVAFGFRYSIDRGWIGPPVRVGLGLALGVGLILLSTRLHATRLGLSRVLGGGGIASLYLSLWASFQLYGLLGHSAAFAGMIVVTVLAFALAARDDDPVHAIVGALGGYATPLVLSSGEGSLPVLMVYVALLTAGVMAIYLQRGWRVVLWLAVVGAWGLAGLAAAEVRSVDEWLTVRNRWAVELGAIAIALFTWLGASLRELRVATTPLRSEWRLAPHQLALTTPLVLLAVSSVTWHWNEDHAGQAALALAVAWGATALLLRTASGEPARRLGNSHAIVAVTLVAISVGLLLDDGAQLVGLAAQSLALHVLAVRFRAKAPAVFGSAIGAVVYVLLLERLEDGIGAGPSVLRAGALADLSVLAVFAATAWLSRGTMRGVHFVAALLGLLVWLFRELSPLGNGEVWVTASWFATAIALVIAGLRSDTALVRRCGAGVLALTVGKLFLFDLQRVDAIWRVITFLAFGGILLGLGYAFPTLWRDRRTDGASEAVDRSA